MALTPADIKNWEFKKGFRGYQQAEVDEFLLLVIETLEENIREREKLLQQIASLKEKLVEWENKREEIKQMLEKAGRERAKILSEARVGAQKIIEEAKRKKEKFEQEAKLSLKESKGELYELHTLKESFKRKFLLLLENQKKLLEEFENIYQTSRLSGVTSASVVNSFLGSIVTNPHLQGKHIIKQSKHKRRRERGKNVPNPSES